MEISIDDISVGVKDMSIGKTKVLDLLQQDVIDWNIVKGIISSNPDSAKDIDKNGYLSLHLAAIKNASDDVICLLLNAYPAATFHRAKKQELPIHCAAKGSFRIGILKIVKRFALFAPISLITD